MPIEGDKRNMIGITLSITKLKGYCIILGRYKLSNKIMIIRHNIAIPANINKIKLKANPRLGSDMIRIKYVDKIPNRNKIELLLLDGISSIDPGVEEEKERLIVNGRIGKE
jgi:hypothetical protein